MLVGGYASRGHTTGAVRRGCRDLVMISSLFFGCGRRIDCRRGAKGRMLDVGCWILVGHRRPFDSFYADDFGAGWGFGLGFRMLDRRCANQSHGAAVEFLAGVFGGAFEANLVAVEVGQTLFGPASIQSMKARRPSLRPGRVRPVQDRSCARNGRLRRARYPFRRSAPAGGRNRRSTDSGPWPASAREAG